MSFTRVYFITFLDFKEEMLFSCKLTSVLTASGIHQFIDVVSLLRLVRDHSMGRGYQFSRYAGPAATRAVPVLCLR